MVCDFKSLTMFLAIVKIYPHPGCENTVIDVLDSLKGPMTALSDCLGVSITIEAGEDREICYTEQWATREALDRHLRSALYSRVLEAMESSRLPPKVAFYEANDLGGLELVELTRTPKEEFTEPDRV